VRWPRAFGVDAKTVRKWRERYRQEGEEGLKDRSSRPNTSPSRLDAGTESEIAALRGQICRRRLDTSIYRPFGLTEWR
jgi:transposase-like protein